MLARNLRGRFTDKSKIANSEIGNLGLQPQVIRDYRSSPLILGAMFRFR
jgi:hypothetical protein